MTRLQRPYVGNADGSIEVSSPTTPHSVSRQELESGSWELGKLSSLMGEQRFSYSVRKCSGFGEILPMRHVWSISAVFLANEVGIRMIENARTKLQSLAFL